MRIAVGTDSTIDSPVFVAPNGETPTATTGLPTITVTRADGTELEPPTAVAVDQAPGQYTTMLTAEAHTDLLDALTITWSGTADTAVQTYSQTVDVVGGHYATLLELRALPGLESSTEIPTGRLREARDEFADIAENYRGVAYVPRYQYEPLGRRYGDPWGIGYLSHLQIRALRSVTVDDTAVDDLTGITYLRPGVIDWSLAAVFLAVGEVVVGYEHGYDQPPEALRRACRQYVRSTLLGDLSGVPRDSYSMTADGVTIRYSTPDKQAARPTGYIEVDRLLNSVTDERVPSIAGR